MGWCTENSLVSLPLVVSQHLPRAPSQDLDKRMHIVGVSESQQLRRHGHCERKPGSQGRQRGTMPRVRKQCHRSSQEAIGKGSQETRMGAKASQERWGPWDPTEHPGMGSNQWALQHPGGQTAPSSGKPSPPPTLPAQLGIKMARTIQAPPTCHMYHLQAQQVLPNTAIPDCLKSMPALPSHQHHCPDIAAVVS